MKLHLVTMSRGDSSRLKDWILYHHQIGFDYFHIILDNPIDDSASVLESIRSSKAVNIEYSVRGPEGEYFDGLVGEARIAAVKQWKQDNRVYIKESGFPIIDPLSDRQYRILPQRLEELRSRFPEDWVAILDVDEYVAILGPSTVKSLLTQTASPRVRLLNFNFDMTGWTPGQNVREFTKRWSRTDIEQYGKGWDKRVKSIVRLSHSLPMVSVHAISAGQFEIVPLDLARLHHYKFPNQSLPLDYSVTDTTLASVEVADIP